jgi:hypothetical protein
MPMFMLNGKQYGGNGGNYQVAKMSKADYDALTDAQKNDGTLRIVVDSAGNSVNYMSAQVAGAKTDDTLTNLLNPTLATTTINGVTCTNNGDGTYTLNGSTVEFNATECTKGGSDIEVCQFRGEVDGDLLRISKSFAAGELWIIPIIDQSAAVNVIFKLRE